MEMEIRMASKSLRDNYSLENLLFNKAIPNYVIPTPVNGHKVYTCFDCGDKFIFQSSYESHINRKPVKITYMCRKCNVIKIFNNRCNLLSHIRSHSFKTSTITLSDLKVEPIPYEQPKITTNASTSDNAIKPTTQKIVKSHINKTYCTECEKEITCTGVIYKDRAKHFMQPQSTKEVYSCPVCLFTLPSRCGLRVHLRIHLQTPPFYCAECGIQLTKKNVVYPYNHDCEGFNMMRATLRTKCLKEECPLFHPTDYKEHMRNNHLKRVYKCPFCIVACFNEQTIEKHMTNHKSDLRAIMFYQCEMCPGRLVFVNQIDNHLTSHVNIHVYPCWGCGKTFKEVSLLLKHQLKKHLAMKEINKQIFESILDQNTNSSKSPSEETVPEQKTNPKTHPKQIYRVVKRCDQCMRSFIYKCKYEQISILPTECPYKCSADKTTPKVQANKSQIVCGLCKNKMSEDWEDIKQHYSIFHKEHYCIDPKIVLSRINDKKTKKKNKTSTTFIKKVVRKRNKPVIKKNQPNESIIVSNEKLGSKFNSSNGSEFVCSKCAEKCENKEMFEHHMLSHRDPCMAYQCMECGQCFVVKPSFSTHLLLEHGISDAEDYINKKQCYNQDALVKYQDIESNEPLRENQCKICRDQFENSDDLKKHFRVHGMAFLMNNSTNKNSNS